MPAIADAISHVDQIELRFYRFSDAASSFGPDHIMPTDAYSMGMQAFSFCTCSDLHEEELGSKWMRKNFLRAQGPRLQAVKPNI